MALAKLGRYNDHVVALDGDTKNSTFSELFKNEHPNRYVEFLHRRAEHGEKETIALQSDARRGLGSFRLPFNKYNKGVWVVHFDNIFNTRIIVCPKYEH